MEVARHRGSTAEAEELAASGLLDSRWYRTRYPDILAAGLAPVEHYLRFGAAEGRWPNPYFNTAWYVAANPDVAGAGLNPAIHFHRHGDLEGRRPHALVDPAWYRHAYELPNETRMLPHFLTMRHSGRYAPSAELWAALHIPGDEGQEPGDDPFSAYMHAGQAASVPDVAVVRASGLLDANFYLINANDVHAANVDPVEHYCRFGWREGRKPNIYFDPVWYSRTNADLVMLGVNPLLHYILVGEPADRRPVPFFEPEWYRQVHGVPAHETALGHYLARRRTQTVSPNHLFDVAWYVAANTPALGPNRDPFAHYLQVGTLTDVDPSPTFDAAAYRKRHMGRASRGFRQFITPGRNNPLVHWLSRAYRLGEAEADPDREDALALSAPGSLQHAQED